MRITLLSDTHGTLPADGYARHLDWADEIWHAGDFGPLVADALDAFGKPVRGVWGNIDEAPLRHRHPKINAFEAGGAAVWMTHIGGYPGRYAPGIRAALLAAAQAAPRPSSSPVLFICGHSHILKVMPDPALGVLHLNPGAAGRYGFHVVRTLLRFQLNDGRISDLQAVELGKRA